MRLVLRGQEGVLLRQVAEDIREHSGPLPQGDHDHDNNDGDDDDNDGDEYDDYDDGDNDGDNVHDDNDDAQGELHLTESVCPRDFLGELHYWGLSALHLGNSNSMPLDR